MATELPDPTDKELYMKNAHGSSYGGSSVGSMLLMEDTDGLEQEPLVDTGDSFEANQNPKSDAKVSNSRSLNFILDTSALLQGMGNVKRWFDAKYSTAQLLKNQGKAAENLSINCYIPANTLYELQDIRRNSSIQGPNAKWALSFLDQILDSDATNNEMSNEVAPEKNLLSYNVELESRTRSFPTWNTALKYTMHTEKVDDLDMGTKFLIRSCVFKAFIERKSSERWYVITEDVSRRKVGLFGVDCLNVNEAELLLFCAHDITESQLKAPGSEFNFEHDMYESKPILTRIDTSLYDYKPLGLKKGKQLRRAKETTGNVSKVEGIIKEDFNMVNYAPRPEGKVWMPSEPSKPKKKKNRRRKKPQQGSGESVQNKS